MRKEREIRKNLYRGEWERERLKIVQRNWVNRNKPCDEPHALWGFLCREPPDLLAFLWLYHYFSWRKMKNSYCVAVWTPHCPHLDPPRPLRSAPFSSSSSSSPSPSRSPSPSSSHLHTKQTNRENFRNRDWEVRGERERRESLSQPNKTTTHRKRYKILEAAGEA